MVSHRPHKTHRRVTRLHLFFCRSAGSALSLDTAVVPAVENLQVWESSRQRYAMIVGLVGSEFGTDKCLNCVVHHHPLVPTSQFGGFEVTADIRHGHGDVQFH